MTIKIISASLLSLMLAGTAVAQQSDDFKTKKDKKEENIIIRKKGDKEEKTVIIIDGDKVTVNGKSIDDLKDSDIQVFVNKAHGMAMNIAPHIRSMAKARVYNDMAATNNRAMLGVTTEKDDKGAKITAVTSESAAEKVGLKNGDIITKVGDDAIANPDDLYTAIGKYKPEDNTKITYLRDGNEAVANATLGKSNMKVMFDFKDDNMQNFNFDMSPQLLELKSQLGNMQNMQRNFKRDYNYNYSFSNDARKPKIGLHVQDVEEGNGVQVLEVEDATPAEKAGLKKDDLITEIDGKDLKNLQELKDKLKDMKEGDTLKIKYKRGNKSQTTELKIPKKLQKADL
jgi:serine protease Do